MRPGAPPIAVFLLLVLLPFLGRGAVVSDPVETFARATRLLEEGAPRDAISLYEMLCVEGWHSPGLYHNLGVALQGEGRSTEALLQLYRAWLIEPFSKTARTNFLSLADDAGLSSSRIKVAERQVSALAWQGPLTVFAVIAFWLGLLVCLFLRRPFVRALGIVSLSMGIFAGIAAWFVQGQLPPADGAWVIAEEPVPLRASHGEGAPSMSKLSPLTPVETAAQRDGWSYVRTRDKLSGWVDSSQIGRLRPWLP